MKTKTSRVPIFLYLLLSFGFSWTVFALCWAHGLFRHGVGTAEYPYLVLYMCGPAFAALLLSMATRKSMPVVQRLGLRLAPNAWFLLAWGLPLAVCLAAVPLSRFGGADMLGPKGAEKAMIEGLASQSGASMPPMNSGALYLVFLAGAAVFGSAVNMIGTLTEELGWRGYLWSQMRPLGFWPASLIIGVIWGLWHAPVIWAGFNYPGAGWLGVLMMTFLCTLMGPAIGFMRERGRSVFAASLFHGTFNAVAGVTQWLLATHPVFWNGAVGWAGMGLLLAADLVLFALYRPNSVGRRDAQAPTP